MAHEPHGIMLLQPEDVPGQLDRETVRGTSYGLSRRALIDHEGLTASAG